MAYEIRWIVNFVAKNDDKYRIEILQDDWNEEPVRLLGAESPIETREDNPTDIFVSVRKQTGFLRIADTGKDLDGNDFDYEDMIPDGVFDFQVRLWLEGNNGTDTLRWIGYIRPDSLTSRIFEYVSIREFTLSCPLSVMYDVPFSFSNNSSNNGTVKSIGQILHAALSVTGIEWQNVYKQNNIEERKDLRAVVSLLNFIKSTTPKQANPPTNNDIDNFTATWEEDGTYWGSIVESVCKFWGWVVYSRGYDIYIITPKEIGLFACFQFDNLNDTSDSTTPTDITTPSYTLVDTDFISCDHTSQRLNGRKTIKVISDVNEQKKIVNPNFNDLTLEYYPSGQIIHVFAPNTMYVFKRFNGNSVFGSQYAKYQYIKNLQIWENRIIQTGTLDSPYIIGLIDSFTDEQFPLKKEFDFSSEVVIFQGGQSDSPIFFVQTINDIIVPKNSAICIVAHGETDSSEGSTNNPSPLPSGSPAEGVSVKAMLKVGDMYWNGSSWQSGSASFNLYIRSDGSITSPENTFSNGGFSVSGILFDNHYGSDGHVIYNSDSGLSGRMKLTLYKSATGNPTSYSVKCILTDISIFIVNGDNKMNPINESEHTLIGVGNNRFIEDYVVDNNISSGRHNTYGYGQLYEPETYKLLENVSVRTSLSSRQVSPEQNLLDRLKALYSSSLKISTIEIKDNITASLPLTRITMNDEAYRVISCSHEWRENKMKLTITDRL